MASLFVYGTLIHPRILGRVLTGRLRTPGPGELRTAEEKEAQLPHLTVLPAVVVGRFELKRVRGQEYPALATVDDSESTTTTLPVRGVLVSGFTPAEIASLDLFEGEEYARIDLKVLVPSSEETTPNDERSSWSASSIAAILDDTLPEKRVKALLADEEGSSSISTQTYVWKAESSELEDRTGPRGPWEFSVFATQKSSRWTDGSWTDAGGPEGVSQEASDEQDQSTESSMRVIPATSPGGFDEVRRTLAAGDTDLGASSSSFNTMSLATAADDPWADPPRTAAATAKERGDNPWAASVDIDTSNNESSNKTVSETTAVPTDEAADWSSEPILQREGIPAGYPLEVEAASVPGYERFGKPVSRWWPHGVQQGAAGANASSSAMMTTSSQRRRYLNFNNGSYGSCPRPVCEAYQTFAAKAEENPDLHYKRVIPEMLADTRERVAGVLNCPASTLVLTMNATTGTNAVLRCFPWQQGDTIIAFSTLYGAVERTLAYLSDVHPTPPTLINIDVSYPISHDDLVDRFTEELYNLKSQGKTPRMAIFDAITSMPGVLLPWERLVKVCKDYSVLSLVDAAHAFGQIPIDLEASQPDFFVTNAHKWGFAHRSCAIFHVPLRNQHYVLSSVPTSWFYRSKAERVAQPAAQEGQDFWKQYQDVGTIDYSSYASLGAALDFADRLGGFKRIMAYNHSLALLGGLTMAKILETELLETSPPSLTASMVNVRLPLVARAIGIDAREWLESKGGGQWLFDTLVDEFATAVRFVALDESRVYARVSAQVWLELEDFEYLGRALKECCRRVNAGEVQS